MSLTLDGTVGGSFPAGSVSAPSLYLSSDTTTGLYRIGANNNGYAVSGVKLLDFISTGLAITGTLGVTGAVTLAGASASAWTTYAPIQAALPAISGNTEFLLGSNVYYDGAFKYVGARTASSIILGSATGAAAKLITMNVTATTGTANGAITFVEALSITKDGAVAIPGTLDVTGHATVGAGKNFQVGSASAAGGDRGTTDPTNAVTLRTGTAPVGSSASSACTFYNTSGEMRVMDGAGNATLLSPHAKDGAWIYDSVSPVTGKHLRIDMEKMMKAINEKFGWDFVHELALEAK